MNTAFLIGTVVLLGTVVYAQRTGPPPSNSSYPTGQTHHSRNETHRVCRENITCDVCTMMNGTCSNGQCCHNFTRVEQTQRVCRENVTCDVCTKLNGTCNNGQCCHNITKIERPPPHERCFHTNGTCGMNCTQKGGRCDGGKCCFRQEPSPHERCHDMNGTCGVNCTQKGGRCDGGKCCFRQGPPPHEHCYDTNGTCGGNCTQKGGRCDGGKCCFGKEPSPHERCHDMNGTCGVNCTRRGGRCDGGKCCFRHEPPPHERCYDTNGTCGGNCTQKGGRCDGGKCCFGKEPSPHERCHAMNGTCGVNCTRRGGRCDGGKCCFGKEPSPHERCHDMNGTCGVNCTQRGGRCDGGKCCFGKEEPHHKGCYPLKGMCGRNCTQKGGRCHDGECCFGEEPDHKRCYHIRGTCGRNCTEKGGKCEGEKCCFRKEGEDRDDDKSWDDGDSEEKDRGHGMDHDGDSDDNDDNKGRDDGDSEEKGWGHGMDHDGDSEDSDGDEYSDYMGMKVRCTKAKCTRSCKERKGFCLAGKCCYKKTAHEAQSRCEKERQQLSMRERLMGALSGAHVGHTNCTASGSYLSRCKGDKCHCLNASGDEVGQPMRAASFDKRRCDEVQKKTSAKHVYLTLKLSSRSLREFLKDEHEDMKTQLKHGIESKVPVNAEVVRLFEGSIMAEINMTLCTADCAATANTSDLYSIGVEVIDQIKGESIVIQVSGQTMIPSEPEITSITTAEMLQSGDTDVKLKERGEHKLGITVALAVAAAGLILSTLGVAFYCYNKKNKTKVKESFFEDIKGKDNPVYMKA